MPYNPPASNNQVGFAHEIRELKRRIDILEARSRVLRAGALLSQNAAGTIEAIFGQQADNSYGLKVLNGAGVLQAVAGVQAAVGADVLSYATASWALSAGSLVTANVSGSGQALVLVLATINLTTNATSSALIGCSVDGANPANAVAQFSEGAQGVGVSATTKLVGVGLITGLTQASHTFQVAYQSVTANAINFLGPTTIVFPL